MSKLIITCDRQEGIARAAVWRGKDLIDLYVDRMDAPDFSGAIARGKVARVLSGKNAAWIDCGLVEKIYVETPAPFKAGAFVSVRVTSQTGEGKAWRGTLLKDMAEGRVCGLLCPPPAPWARALAACVKTDDVVVRFAVSEDCDAFHAQKWPDSFRGELCYKGPVHDGLDEIIDGLLQARVPLSGGANLVIEKTAALVAIDVNAPDAANPLAVNLSAVREAARQVRLRNLGGIVVMDCLKMKDRADASKTINAFTRVAQEDPVKIHNIAISKLGLLEFARSRSGPALADVMGAGR